VKVVMANPMVPMPTLPVVSMRIKNSPKGFDAHDWEGAQDMSAEEQRELARDIDEAVRQGALIASKLGSGGVRIKSICPRACRIKSVS
jgi:hypothetical protein